MTAWIDQNHWHIGKGLRYLTKKSWSKKKACTWGE